MGFGARDPGTNAGLCHMPVKSPTREFSSMLQNAHTGQICGKQCLSLPLVGRWYKAS
jgi:hypothetical protein